MKVKTDHSLLATLRWLHSISRWRVSGLIAASVPLGVLQGLTDIVFGFCLLYFLGNFGLIPAPVLPGWLPQVNPILLLLLMGFIRAALLLASSLTSNLGFESFSVVLRESLVGALRSDARALRISVADASHILSNSIPRSANFVSALSQIALGTLSLLVTIAGLSSLSMNLTFVALLSFLVFGLPVLFTRRLFQGYSTRVYAGTSEFSKGLLKSLRNLDFLRIIGQTESVSRRLSNTNRFILKNYTRYISWITLNSTWPQFGSICIVVTIVLVNRQNSWVETSVLVPFIYLLNRAAVNMSSVISSLGTAQFNRPFLQSLMGQLDSASSERSVVLPMGTRRIEKVNQLAVKNIEVGRTETLVSGLSFSAQSGDFVLFSGESGKGKTTLLMTLLGLIPARSGDVSWSGVPVAELELRDFQSKIAFSGPDPFLLDLSIRENLLLGNEHLRVSEAQIQNALRIAGCDFVSKLPGGIGYPLHEGGEGISAGQKQRLSIARAVLRNPEVLVLDEATANVDIELEQQIFREIRCSLPDVLLLVVSHRRSLDSLATLKLVL